MPISIGRGNIDNRTSPCRKSHDALGRYRMGLGEKTASHAPLWIPVPGLVLSVPQTIQGIGSRLPPEQASRSTEAL